ncbi:MAG: protein-glutamate O-methyltransferase CheR [Polyangiaceae bacterium]
MVQLAGSPERISRADFDEVVELVHQRAGIVLTSAKEELVMARLSKRLRATGIGSFAAYMDLVRKERSELAEMIDVLTTNKTAFFREPAHFDFLREQLVPQWEASGESVAIWSAACSTGEEPYSVAMEIAAASRTVAARTRILATDLSARALERARSATYRPDMVGQFPGDRLRFLEKREREYRILPMIRSMVKFARLNLLDAWPMRGPFSLILCRNVMIYFDKPTQYGLARRFGQLLGDGGMLFIGHSESLGSADVGLNYVQPAVYAR